MCTNLVTIIFKISSIENFLRIYLKVFNIILVLLNGLLISKALNLLLKFPMRDIMRKSKTKIMMIIESSILMKMKKPI